LARQRIPGYNANANAHPEVAAMRQSLLFAILLLPAPLVAQTADEKKATVQFLASLQQPDGGFIAAPKKGDAKSQSSLRATSGAVRAIRYLGGQVPNPEKTLAFVKSCFDAETGAFADTPGGKADLSTTAVGMMAINALQPDTDQQKSVGYLVERAKTFEERRLAVAGMEAAGIFPLEIREWLVEVNKTRNSDGTYGKDSGQARETGSVAAMILRSGNKLSDEQRKAVVAALHAGQRSDGGFGKAEAKESDPETTYRVMRAFYLLKERPKDVEKLKAFVAKHRNADGGYGVGPGQPSTVSGTYYAAVITYWLQD
jgi:hypothetical protein